MPIQEGAKIRLKTGEIASIDEVLQQNVAYIAGVFKKDGGIEIEHVNHDEISSVFEEIEHPLKTGA